MKSTPRVSNGYKMLCFRSYFGKLKTLLRAEAQTQRSGKGTLAECANSNISRVSVFLLALSSEVGWLGGTFVLVLPLRFSRGVRVPW